MISTFERTKYQNTTLYGFSTTELEPNAVGPTSFYKKKSLSAHVADTHTYVGKDDGTINNFFEVVTLADNNVRIPHNEIINK